MAGEAQGAMTFLFTDIEGSTRLWEDQPDTMHAALAVHDTLVRDAIDSHGGRVVKSTGDGAFAVFASPASGVAGAVAAQIALAGAHWPEGIALQARMGLHAGHATEQNGDYFGPDVNRAARVMSAAHGGQIICSASVAEFVRDHGVLVDLGEHRLRDLQSAVHLFQIDSPGLRSAFPPLRSLDAYRSNLPYELSRFVGRDAEMRSLVQLIRSTRVVSVVGVGGVGKTRLALQVGSELLPDFPDGVWLCELAPVLEPVAVPEVVGAAVGYVPPQGVSVAEGLPRFLERKHLLLILDNCEHLIDAVAEFASETTARAPRVSLLNTSREALGVRGEHIAPLASLPLPSADDAASVSASEAGALFVTRAGDARGEFVIDETNAASVRALCARLDGVALAIELAAAQTRLMTPAEIVTRLDQQFRLLTGGHRARLERHQTLRAAIDWSYNLLGDDERTFLDRLSVCVGGFDLDAAAAIAAGIGVEAFEAFELLDALVAKSLVERNDRAGVTRYRLLEMIRQYAAERLNTAGLADAARNDHREHYLALAVALCAEAASANGFAALERLDVEIANIAAAGTWLLATGRAGVVMDFFGNLPFVDPFALPIRGAEELGAIASNALETGLSSHPGFAPTCWWASSRAFFNGDMAAFRALADLARSSPPSDTSALAVFLTAVGAMFDGNAQGAVATAQRAVKQARREGDPAQLAWLLGQLCGFQTYGDPDAALGSAEESLTLARATRSPVVMLYGLMSMTLAAKYVDPPRASAAAEECERIDGTQRHFHSNTARTQLAAIRLATGQIADGLSMWRAVLSTYYDSGERTVYMVALADVARSLVPIDPAAAVALAAIAETDAAAPYAAFGFPGLAELAAELHADVSAARSRASALSYDEATASVLATLDRLITEHQT